MNLELLNRVWKQIETYPDTWVQKDWLTYKPECGTTGCFAGWAAMLSGWEPAYQGFGAVESDIRPGVVITSTARNLNCEEEDVSDIAKRELGLDTDQAEFLFWPYREMEEIQGFVELANRGEDPLPYGEPFDRPVPHTDHLD